MKTRDLTKISFPRNYWKKTKKNLIKPQIVGLDTETEKGKAFLIGKHTNNSNENLRLNDFEDFINFIIINGLNNTLNFFYNLTYDTNAIIKLLPEKKLLELAYLDETNYKTTIIKIVPNKKLIIKNQNKVYEFYDLAQFFNHDKLDNISNKIFNEKKIALDYKIVDEYKKNITKLQPYNITKIYNKIHIPIDIKNLYPKRYDNEEEYKYLIDKYLKKDCKLCYKLGEHLFKISSKYLIPKYFYSQASLSQQYFLENMKRDYSKLPNEVLQYGLNAYNGGRFEVFKRGTYKNTNTYDIKSAYPFHHSKIPALDKGEWRKNKQYEKDSLISIFRAVVEGKSHISPLRHEREKDGLLFYPVGKKEMYFNKKEYDVMKQYGYKIDIIDVWHYFDENPEYPYKFLEKFFYEKELVGKDSPEYMFYKIVINGFYGKMIQVELEKEISEDQKDAVDFYLENGKLKFVKARYKAGLLFNPVVAMEITANTRCQLLEGVEHIQKNIIAFATDSIIVHDAMPLIKLGSKLGEWEKEKHDSDIFTSIGSGVYFYHGQKSMKFRGFGKGYNPDKVMDSIIKGKIKVPVTRNIKLKKAVRTHAYNLKEDFNVIIQDVKTLDLNFDTKRIWEDNFNTPDDVYNKQIISKPYII